MMKLVVARVLPLAVFLVAATVVLFTSAPAEAACCSKYQVGSSCCNIFGCNCDGPCWNAGCKTVCAQGKYPGRTVACNGNDGYYNCCPTGSKCKPSDSCSGKAGDCCCTGGGKTIVSISDCNMT